MDESFGMWYNRINPHDYGLHVKQYWKADTTAMVVWGFKMRI